MYNGIGLRTARGSGTNGYVQSNRAFVKPVNVRRAEEINRTGGIGARDGEWKARTAVEGNKEINEHNRKREVEAQVYALRDELEEEDVPEDEIDKKCDELRQELLARMPTPKKVGTDSHQNAEAKARDDQKLRDAFGIRDDRHVPGAAFDRELQDQLKAQRQAEREARALEEAERARARKQKDLDRRERELKEREKE